ncbi:hypothetical protein Ddye_030415 [Dipteronia dyeriana]|uniref:RNase H type-1 domain-containing protein n=1 Tax=Dipteronia dyeriana TaxID=168575 RepID=A0AAD9TGW2_9ROSI|nr:hypothetical protein Ddye_030415 [Dipteronia dyeriana]
MRPSRNEEAWASRHFLHHLSPSRWSSPLAKSKRKARYITEAPFIVSIRRSSLVGVHSSSSPFTTRCRSTEEATTVHALWSCKGLKSVQKGFDAAVDVDRQGIGVAMVIRDHKGFVMASSFQRIEACYSPQVAEAVVVLRGIDFAVDTNLVPAGGVKRAWYGEFGELRDLNLC